jgi:uncharacterized protein DUF4276
MVTELRIYFEGDSRLRPGFHVFLKEIKAAALSKRCKFYPVDAKGTPAQDYRSGLKANPRALNILLLDSDEPLDNSVVNLLRKKGLEGCDSECIFWMVQVMESWFLADIDALKRFYDGGFQESALEGNPRVEQIPKGDVLSRLKKATRNTKRGEYQKSHAFKLLEIVDPSKVRKVAPNCDRMFSLILAKLS